MARTPQQLCSHKELKLETQTNEQFFDNVRVGYCPECGKKDIRIRTPDELRNKPEAITIVRTVIPSAYIRKE